MDKDSLLVLSFVPFSKIGGYDLRKLLKGKHS